MAASVVNVAAQSSENLFDFEYSGVHYKKVSESAVEISPVSLSYTAAGEAVYTPTDGNFTNGLPDSACDEEGNWYEVIGIGAHAFEGSGEVSQLYVNGLLNDKLQYIGESAFRGCRNMVMAEIPKSVVTVGKDAFNGCSKLKYLGLGVSGSISSEPTMTILDGAFCNTPALACVFVGQMQFSLPQLDAFATESDSKVHTTFFVDKPYEYNYNCFSRYNCASYGSFTNCSAVYSGTSPEFSLEFNSNLPQEISYSLGNVDPIYDVNAVYGKTGYCWVTFRLPYSYNMSFGIHMTYNYSIEKAPLYLNVKDCTRYYGEDNPEFEITVEGYVNGEGEGVFSTLPMIVNGVADWAPELPTKNSPVGEYELVAMAALNYPQNYELHRNNGKLTITQAPQCITWDQEFPTIETGNDIELYATTSSGEPVIYTSSNPEIADVEGNILHARSEGSVTITATNDGSENYLAAEPITKNILISVSSSISEVADETKFKIEAESGHIIVSGVSDDSNIRIVSVDGKIVYFGKNRIIPLDKGIYLVIVGKCVIKVAI